MVHKGWSVKDASLAKGLSSLLPSVKTWWDCSRELSGLWPFMGMLCPKDRDQLWHGHLLGKKPRFDSPCCYGPEATEQISSTPSTLLSSPKWEI